MARSSAIYVVVDDHGFPDRAFTVKHELVSYLLSLGENVVYVPAVFRLADGRDRRVTELGVNELLP